ncbi:LacI family transcriptional regulator [Pelagibacterium sp. 26DY04]|uniref:LacI family DNA-binding transcriptional regulator n=1 Tax=Pelagibacterium sp. 26DY04 TaxID=2967130 RepID=UPI0028155490|nr:LacI family DNA-binding transcriptional regulator [Pelagibacterium sp. 26DY04]WMT88623.1 LacI family transcriptional regulator [Pelagibacterium sp. 26DY04]
MITIKDVARHAGVSIATVSRVLNAYPHVRPLVRERVQAAISELGYAPNRLAASFRTQQSRVVGVFLRQQRTPFSSALAYAIESAMFEEGYRALLCSTNGDPDREETYVDSMLELRAEGVVIRPTGSAARTARNVARLKEAGIAVVFADMKPKMNHVSAVICDNYSGGYEGMRHLIGLGHRKIGIIAGRQAQTSGGYGVGNVGSERMRGITQAAKDLAADVELVFSGAFDEATLEVGAAEADALLTRRPDVTALFGTTDILAIGAMQTAHRRGIAIPQDLSILGYDGIMESGITFPTLSTVRQPIHEMGTLAARTLLHHIRTPETPVQQIVLENAVLVRDSTGSIRH